ncbi:MAG: glycerate kinase [Oscillatoriales cyanobacterium CG2_30_44_21]|nr:MAG: glycerate kinase [Oscillatoriales cyanobacterium CG2_30_44_21]
MIKNIPIRIFKLIIKNQILPAADYELLICKTRENKYFLELDIADRKNISWELAAELVDQRSQLLRSTYLEISQGLADHNIHIGTASDIFHTLWHYWLPLARRLANRHQQIGRTFIQGLLGGQGLGKTTLGLVLEILLKNLGKTLLSFSLDDLYKTYSDRQKLKEQNPEMIWRGPPSTHDVELGQQVLQQLRDRPFINPYPIKIPRFDKSLHNGAGDRTAPAINYQADIVLFEGWFVGLQPLPICAFNAPIPPILSDRDQQFAIACNAYLGDYQQLWDYLDSLIVLIPQDFSYSQQWRLEAEHKLISSGKSGMSDREIIQFVKYFWKALHPELFIAPMLADGYQNSQIDLIITIGRSRLPIKITTPS